MARERTVAHFRPSELAHRFGMKSATLLSWIRTEKLPALNISSTGRPRYRVYRPDLEALLRSQPATAGPPRAATADGPDSLRGDWCRPSQIARAIGVKTDTVLAWIGIGTGQLRAFNIATNARHPHYRVHVEELRRFLLDRGASPGHVAACLDLLRRSNATPGKTRPPNTP